MAFEQQFTQERKSVSTVATRVENTSNNFFDCNICFDFAQEPVVTLCGHLYCWPCIFKWLHVQSASLASDEPPRCPVCKSDISHTTMIPLYGHGQVPAETNLGKIPGNSTIPPRPSKYGTQTLVSNTSHSGQQLPYHYPNQNLNSNPNPYINFGNASSSSSDNQEGNVVSALHHPFMGNFRGRIYTRVFGNSEGVYPNSYYLMGSDNRGLRLQEFQANISLSRVSFFLFCCLLLCLFLF